MDEQAKARLADLRQRLISAGKRKTKTFQFGEETVTLRQLSALDTAGYIDNIQSDDNAVRMKSIAEMIVASVVDEDGNLIFTSEHIPVILSEMGAHGFGELATEVLAFNTHTKATREDALKKSEAPASGLLSDSQDI